MKARETEAVEEAKITQAHRVSELKNFAFMQVRSMSKCGKHCWSRGEQHFRIDKMHFVHWEKDIESAKDGATNHRPPRTLQPLLVLQKTLRCTEISTTFVNSSDFTPSITPPVAQPSTSITPSAFVNGPPMPHYPFQNYYQPTTLPPAMPLGYTDNYHTSLAISSFKEAKFGY